MEDAKVKADAAKEKVVTEYIPKAKRIAQAAADAAKETDGDVRTRAAAISSAAEKALAEPAPKKRWWQRG